VLNFDQKLTSFVTLQITSNENTTYSIIDGRLISNSS
jgi:hypothetical protein